MGPISLEKYSCSPCLVSALRKKPLPSQLFKPLIISLRVALVVGITLPRVPAFSFNEATPIAPATGSWNESIPTYINVAPANFSFPAYASLQLDTTKNYLPLKFKYLRATIYDLNTLRQIATGDLGRKTFPAKTFPEIMLPLNFTYLASNSSDQTCMFFSFLNSPISDIIQSRTCTGLAGIAPFTPLITFALVCVFRVSVPLV